MSESGARRSTTAWARPQRSSQRRNQVRDELVDATLRALATVGPALSMDDLAREAGVAKPKLYRYFDDKADLHAAIAERILDIVWTRVLGEINPFTDPVSDLLHRGTAEYVRVVEEHPNVMSFLALGRAQSATEFDQLLEAFARRFAHLIAGLLARTEVDADSIVLATTTAVGAVASATEWWIATKERGPTTMTQQRFSEYLATVLLRLIDATATFNQLHIDPALPLHAAFTAQG